MALWVILLPKSPPAGCRSSTCGFNSILPKVCNIYVQMLLKICNSSWYLQKLIHDTRRGSWHKQTFMTYADIHNICRYSRHMLRLMTHADVPDICRLVHDTCRCSQHVKVFMAYAKCNDTCGRLWHMQQYITYSEVCDICRCLWHIQRFMTYADVYDSCRCFSDMQMLMICAEAHGINRSSWHMYKFMRNTKACETLKVQDISSSCHMKMSLTHTEVHDTCRKYFECNYLIINSVF